MLQVFSNSDIKKMAYYLLCVKENNVLIGEDEAKGGEKGKELGTRSRRHGGLHSSYAVDGITSWLPVMFDCCVYSLCEMAWCDVR